jgi:hypothetical protein
VSARASRTFAVLGFASTHDALDAETALERGGIDVVPIPAPKSIGSLCGIALRITPDQLEHAAVCLSEAGVSIAATCEIEDV